MYAGDAGILLLMEKLSHHDCSWALF